MRRNVNKGKRFTSKQVETLLRKVTTFRKRSKLNLGIAFTSSQTFKVNLEKAINGKKRSKVNLGTAFTYKKTLKVIPEKAFTS